MKLLLGKDSVNPDSRDNSGRTPLSYAARTRSEVVMKLLLAQDGFSPDSRDSDSRPPLSYATGRGASW